MINESYYIQVEHYNLIIFIQNIHKFNNSLKLILKYDIKIIIINKNKQIVTVPLSKNIRIYLI